MAGPLGTPLATPSHADEVTDRLITAIAIGEYLPGSKLPAERDLAASLHVGRMTVRAALARLVEQGLLETRLGRGGGSFVLEQWSPTSSVSVERTLATRFDTMHDTRDAVARLHGAIAQAAAENHTADDKVVLQERLEAFRAAESGVQSQKADGLLHTAIFDAAHSATLKSVLIELEARLSLVAPAHLWGSHESMRDMERRSLIEHVNLITAICERRAADASAIARAHVGIDLELLEAAKSKAGVERQLFPALPATVAEG
jgi:GntR family transcriptional regulator, transcriptional repressor for pyruvate dehydrogenase complex